MRVYTPKTESRHMTRGRRRHVNEGRQPYVRPMYEDLVNRLCSKKENLAFTLPNGDLCAQHNAGKSMAVKFCQEGNNFTQQGRVCSADGLRALRGGWTSYV